jgi:hypothetical protein
MRKKSPRTPSMISFFNSASRGINIQRFKHPFEMADDRLNQTRFTESIPAM